MESFEQEHPFIRAEVNGLSGRRVSHEWVACDSFDCSVRFYQWSQATACSAPIKPNPTNLENYMDSTFSSTLFLKNGSTVKFGTGSATFQDDLNVITVLIANNSLLEAMASHLLGCDRSTQEHFVQLLTNHIRAVEA
jgi:hypothetical protein